MHNESPRLQWHKREVQAYSLTHGRLLTFLYANRRLWIGLFILTPVLLVLAASAWPVAIAWTVVLLVGVGVDQYRVVPRMPS